MKEASILPLQPQEIPFLILLLHTCLMPFDLLPREKHLTPNHHESVHKSKFLALTLYIDIIIQRDLV